jgi:hypothetical protein
VFYGDRRDKPDWPYSFLLELRDGNIHKNYYGICHTLSFTLEMRELRDGKIHNKYYGISHTFYVTVNAGT